MLEIMKSISVVLQDLFFCVLKHTPGSHLGSENTAVFTALCSHSDGS